MGKKNLEILESLESNYVPAIKKADNDKDLNEVLFALVLYLMRPTCELSNSIIGRCDKLDRRDIFSSFGEVAQIACDFYQASKEHLDPVALKGEIGQQLEAASKRVVEVNSAIKELEKSKENLQKKEEELLKKENELNEKNESYENLKEKVSKFKEIEARVTVESLNKLKLEEEELNLHLGENSKIANKLKEYDISSVEKFLNKIDHSKNIVEKEIKWFDDVLKEVIAEQERRNESLG